MTSDSRGVEGETPPPPLQHSEDGPWPTGASAAPTVPVRPAPTERTRAPIYIALFCVAVLSGAALFVSGFTLGAQQSITPGTSAQNQQLFEPFWDAWNKVTTQYVGEYDRRLLLEGAIKGVFDALGDPYSGYMTSEEYRSAFSAISGEFEGIGAQMVLQTDTGAGCAADATISDSCHLVIQHVLRRSPALAAGLQIDDRVLSVDGASVLGKTVDETVELIRGLAGTNVTLGLEREGEPLSLTISRAVIEAESVTSSVIANGRVGYLKIDGFSGSAAKDFVDLLTELVEEKDLQRIVLDLRDDPGGFVDAAQRISSQFLADGPIFWEEDSAGNQSPKAALPGGVATDRQIQLVVLVNGGTASASEIVAGALQDTERATLVGEKTFGKGTIQTWHALDDGAAGGFRLSVLKWLTPNRTWIHGQGISPDVVVARPADAAPEDDPQLDAAIEILTTGSGVGVLPRAA